MLHVDIDVVCDIAESEVKRNCRLFGVAVPKWEGAELARMGTHVPPERLVVPTLRTRLERPILESELEKSRGGPAFRGFLHLP